MQTIRELVTKWVFKSDQAPLDKIEHKLDQIRGRLEFLAAAEVVKGVYELTERFAHFAEELQIAAVSAGITVEQFEKLAFAAGKSAVSQEEMAQSMARLSRMVYQARMGMDVAQKAFLQAGFSADQIKGFRTGSDAMLALADRFKSIQDPIQKQALAMQLMGRGSVNMVGFLSQGSSAIRGMGIEAERLGVVLSTHQVEALVKVEHSLYELWSVFKAFGATIASYFAPSIETAIQDFLKFWEVNKKLIDTNLRAWVWDITFALGFVYEIVKIVVQKFFDFAKSHELLTRRALEFIVILGMMVGALWTVQKMLGFVKGALEVVGAGLSPLKFLWEKAFMPAIMLIGSLVRTLLSQLLLKLAMLFESVLPAVSEAFLALGAAIEATPVGWLVTALAALVVVLHDAYVLLFGSGKWEDTWIAKAFNAVKGFGSKALSFLGITGGTEGEKSPGLKGSLDTLNSVPGLNAFPGLGGIGASTQNNQYSVSAPVTVHVPPGSSPKEVAQAVKEGISDHLDRVNRRMQQSFTPAQAY